ncbi:hypothetical protein KFE25_004959 [Diacronema lutheri]|uniref:Rieske domain-containing protein n=2 Tax=Diacronema lutheri TaxID=2081491 RepID=A0A8J6CDE3_DIALT|nr:hypothetical protein KFE25_004959 [Diacronema lutheri]
MSLTNPVAREARRVVVSRLSALRRAVEVDIGVHATAVVLPLAQARASAAPSAVAFVNRCPHAGTPLNYFPDAFHDRSGEYLMCATHGALFRQSDGLCVHGPCAGDSLTPLHVELERAPLEGGCLSGEVDGERGDLLVVLHVPSAHAPQMSPPAVPCRSRAPPTTFAAAPAGHAGRAAVPPPSLDAELDELLRELDGPQRATGGMDAFYAPRGHPAKRTGPDTPRRRK